MNAGVIKLGVAPISYVLTKKEEEEPAKPGFTVSVPAAVLADVDGLGKMLVEVRNSDPKVPRNVHLRLLSGAYIAKDSEPPLTGADHVATAGAWLLNLNGLRAGTPIVLRAFRMEGNTPVAVDDLQVQVVAATPKKEPPRAGVLQR